MLVDWPFTFTIHEKLNSDQNPGHFASLSAGSAVASKAQSGYKCSLNKKISPDYFLIHFLICNFSLPCTPFDTTS